MAMKYFLWMDFYTPYYEKCVIFIHMYVRVRGDEYEKNKNYSNSQQWRETKVSERKLPQTR